MFPVHVVNGFSKPRVSVSKGFLPPTFRDSLGLVEALHPVLVGHRLLSRCLWWLLKRTTRGVLLEVPAMT
jgi:hypothetical protein